MTKETLDIRRALLQLCYKLSANLETSKSDLNHATYWCSLPSHARRTRVPSAARLSLSRQWVSALPVPRECLCLATA